MTLLDDDAVTDALVNIPIKNHLCIHAIRSGALLDAIAEAEKLTAFADSLRRRLKEIANERS